MATTSGTVATYSFTGRKIVEHALRRAGYTPEQAGSEWLQIAQDLLFVQLSEYVNAGFPLWTRVFGMLPITIGSADVTCATGTVDVLTSFWRILNPYRGAASLISGGDASVLFAGQPNADVVIPGANPGVTVNFGSVTEFDTIGVLLGGAASLSTGVQVKTSTDGVTFTVAQTLPVTTYSPQQWAYFDLNPTLTSQFVQIVAPIAGSWTLNQLNIGLANSQDIPNGPLNIDDYYNLPNKLFRSDRPNSAYVDRQINAPVLKIWPTPNLNAFYNGTVSVLTRRYIQDPGNLTNDIEVPSRWYNGIISRLGVRLMDELPDPDPSSQASYFNLTARTTRRQLLEQEASKAEAMMWSEERVRAPIRLAPDISPYTR